MTLRYGDGALAPSKPPFNPHFRLFWAILCFLGANFVHNFCLSYRYVVVYQSTLIFFYKKPFYKKPRVKSSKITENNKKLFRSITNFLRNLFVVFWHTLRNLTYFCSVFLIFLTYKKSIRNFFDQKLPKSEETF